MGQHMVGLLYLSRRALSHSLALIPHAITEYMYGKPDCLWNACSIAVFKIPIHTPPRCGPERKTANAVEGSAPIGAGARAVNLDGARSRQLRLIFDPIRGPND